VQGGFKVATHVSAEKRNRQNKKKRTRNAAVRSKVHTQERKLQEAIESKDKAAIRDMLSKTISVISTAGSKGVIHKGTASRKIARLSRKAHLIIGK
jgi:small subunit ribosomal protein S20